MSVSRGVRASLLFYFFFATFHQVWLGGKRTQNMVRRLVWSVEGEDELQPRMLFWDVWYSIHSLGYFGLVAAQLYILYNLNGLFSLS